MVHSHESRSAWNERRRLGEEFEPASPNGRAPFPGEILGGHPAPPFEVNGMNALAPVLPYVRFPASKADLVTSFGEVRVPIDRVTLVPIRELIARLGPERFATRHDLEAAARRALQEMRPRAEDGRGAGHRVP